MKSFIIIIVAAIFFSSSVMAQNNDYSLKQISLSTGKTTLTNGVTATLNFSSPKNDIQIDLNQDLGEVLFWYSLGDKVKWAPTFGFYENVMWGGPAATLQLGNFGLFVWEGASMGSAETGKNSVKPEFMFSYLEASYAYDNFYLAYVFQNYYKNIPENIVQLKKTWAISGKSSFYFNAGYMLRAKEPIWSMGIKTDL